MDVVRRALVCCAALAAVAAGTVPASSDAAAPGAQCPDRLNRSTTLSLSVTPSSGALTVGWLTPRDSAIKSFRVAAVAQQFVSGKIPPPVWKSAPFGGNCHADRATISGLVHGMNYVIWLDAVITDDQQGSGTFERTVGTSSVVTVK